MAIKITMIVTIIMMIIYSIKELLKGTHNNTQHHNNAHPTSSPVDCDEVQLTNEQCHMVLISILWYRESWTAQLEYTFETKQENKSTDSSNSSSGPHQLLICICLLERAYFNFLECSNMIEYLYFLISDKACNKITYANITSTITIIIYS